MGSFNLWLAGVLGWEVGPVVMCETLLAIGLLWLIIWGLIHIVVEIRWKIRESEGIEKAGWILLLIAPALLLFVIHWILAVITIAGIASYINGHTRNHRDW